LLPKLHPFLGFRSRQSRATTAGTPSGAGIRLTSTAGGKAKRQLHGCHNGVGGSRGGQNMHKWRFNQQK